MDIASLGLEQWTLQMTKDNEDLSV